MNVYINSEIQGIYYDVSSFGTLSTYVSTDSYSTITGWILKALEDNGWTAVVTE